MVLGLLAAAIFMFAINKPRMDAVALIMMALLPLTGVVTMSETLSGFSDGNIVLIAALFVIGDGLVRTGVARKLGDWLTRTAGNSEVRLTALLMLVVCGLGSVMSSTAVTAIFIPVALRIAQTTGTSASRLMMPLSVAALISGMMTLVATAPNLVVNAELTRTGQAGFRFFSFTPFGVPILLLGIGYMLIARRWLAAKDPSVSGGTGRPNLAEWVERYRLTNREFRVRILPGSPLIGQTIEQTEIRAKQHATIIAIERQKRFAHEVLAPTPKRELLENDIVLLDLFSPHPDIEEVKQRLCLEELPLSGAYFSDRAQEIGMAEVIVPVDSELIGKTIVESEFRSRTGLTIIGLRRGKAAVQGNISEAELALGDTLLVVGPWRQIERLKPSEAGVLILGLPAEADQKLPVPGRSLQAVLCLLLVVGLMISGVIPNVQAALFGCLLMGACGVVTLASAYRSIDWKTIVLIVGMLPFSTALQRTGGVDLMAHGMMSIIGGSGAYVVLGVLFAITALLGMFISNTATAVLMAPVALAVAKELGASPYPFAMIVALAASTAFMTPVSSPVNTLVVTPGNYSFGDFVKVGVPFALIVMVVCILLVPLLLPL